MNRESDTHHFLLYLFFIIYGAYYIADMQSSANVVVKQVSGRASVHYFLILMIALLGCYMLFVHGSYVIDQFRTAFLFFIGWSILVDFVNGISFWSIATHIGLLVFFFLTSFFFAHYISSADNYKKVLVIEFILWGITLLYSIKAYFNYRNYMGDANTSPVLNMAYNMLVFVPLLLQLKNNKLRFGSILITVAYIIISLKRGAIVALLGMFFVYWYTNREDRNLFVIRKQTLFIIFVSVIGLVVFSSYGDRIMNGALMDRFSLESLRYGSNRDVIYASAIDELRGRSFLQLILGTGSGSTTTFIGSGAHNEILEIAISYGFVGVILYLSVIISGIRQISYMKWSQVSCDRVAIYSMSLFYIVAVGIFGSSLFSHMTFHIVLAMGMVCALNYYSIDENEDEYE